MTRRQRKAMEQAYARPTARALASRAIYQGEEHLPKLSLTFQLESGEVIQFELPLVEAAKFIEMATASYHAALPDLRIGGRGGW